MQLYEICPEAREQGVSDAEIRSVTDNTGELQGGDIFVCIRGKSFDGHSAAAEMLEKGAAAVIVEEDVGLDRQVIVENTRAFLSEAASRYYGSPTKELKLIACTGTNGKSTVTALIKHILEKHGKKVGAIGTVGYDVAGKTYEAHLTTPHAMDLYRYFREMADNGAEYCVVEASSQALSQLRFARESFALAVFTNLTQDHLDWHGTMDSYYKAKRSLFDMSERALVCIDDKYGEKLVKYLDKKKSLTLATYSAEDMADYYAINVKTGNGGIAYWLSALGHEQSYPVKLCMPGSFNVANSLAAVGACTELGFALGESVDYLSESRGVRGRSEVVYDGDITVICDYAHTEDALQKFLTSVASFATRRIICVFGAAGERDAGKRPAMGEAVARICDYVVVTSDNPRFENPQDIIDEVLRGVKKIDTPFEAHVDRREAIRAAVLTAEKGDIITLCGKGHETYQVIGDEYQPFDEREIVREYIKEIHQK